MSTVLHGRSRSRRATLLTALGIAVASAGFAASADAATVTGTIAIADGVASPTRTSAPAGGSYFWFEDPPRGSSVKHPNATPNNLNPDYTLLVAGSSGLTLGTGQPLYVGGVYAGSEILDPQTFDGAPFGVHTTGAVTLQYNDDNTGARTNRDQPLVSSDVSAWTVHWGVDPNFLLYDQGADQVGSGRDHDLRGTYNESTGEVSLTWSSEIYNAFGPPAFNDGTGHWTIEGTI